MKRHITLTVDEDLIEKAKKKGLVISEVLNQGLMDFTRPAKQDFADASLKIVCSECGDEIEKGYRCERHKLAICDNCHKNFPMHKCKHIGDQHIHERFGETIEPLQ